MCGFVGIVGRQDCAADILLGLQALQHRGQDAGGVGTIDTGSFPIKRRSGLMAQNFGPEEIAQLSRPDGRLEQPLQSDQVEDPSFGRRIYLRRTAAKSRVTIFEGGHEGIAKAAVEWLAGHQKAGK